LVGENRFASVSVDLHDSLVNMTAQATDVIAVRPGDVLGFYVSTTDVGNEGGIEIDQDLTEDVVFFALEWNPQQVGLGICVSVATLSFSSTGAPVVRVDVGE
jgi:hypothetical protein